MNTDCKSVIRRFESDLGLSSNPQENQAKSDESDPQVGPPADCLKSPDTTRTDEPSGCGEVVVYVATNRVTRKQYVGITASGVAARWGRHIADAKNGYRKFALHSAICKYGVDSFDVVHFASARDWQGACAAEKEIIASLRTFVPNGYNMTPGGDGVVELPPESMASMRAKCRAYRHTEDAKKRIGEASRQRPRSAETNLKISASRKGQKLSAEHCRKMGDAKRGKPMPPRTAEHRAKIAEGLRRAHARKGRAWRVS